MNGYSGNIRLRLPADLHARLSQIADGVGVSLNTLMVTLLAEGATRRANLERSAPADVAEAMAEAVLDSITTPTRSGELIRQLDESAPEWRMWIPPDRLVEMAGETLANGRDPSRGENMNSGNGRAIADKVVADLADGRFQDVEAAVKPNGRSTLSARNIEEVWNRVVESTGSYREAGEPLTSSVSGGHLFDYPLEFSEGSAHLQVVILEGEVAGLLLRPGSPTGQWNK